MKRGSDARYDRGQQAKGRGEAQDAEIDVGLVEARHVRGRQADQRLQPPIADRHSGESAGACEGGALRQKLRRHSLPSGPQRIADGDFARTRGAADEQQVGDVHARDQQHQQGRSEQDEQRLPQRSSDDEVAQRVQLPIGARRG